MTVPPRETGAGRRLAPLVVLVLVLTLVGVAWWLNHRTDGETFACSVPSNGRSDTCPPTSGSRPAKASTTAKGATRSATRAPTQGAGIDPETKLPWIDASALPREAQQVLTTIDRGGPYAYDRDGINFGNFEGRLPRKPSGYYREYTVKTPGESDRGARRIVTGDNDKQFFWTDDHYETFSRVRR